MEPDRAETGTTGAAHEEDDFERLIRWGLQDSVAGAEPSAEVWPKVLARVQESSASDKQPRRSGRRAMLPLASLVQAVVISSLLLAFGLNLDQGLGLSAREYVLSSTPTVQKSRVREDVPVDALRRYVLLRMAREQAQSVHLRGLDQGW